MTSYTKLNEQRREKHDQLITDNQIFFAFNKGQLREGISKHNISKDNKMSSIGMGGYMPHKNVDNYIKDLKELDEWYAVEEKKIKVVIKPVEIDYELYDDMLCVLPPIYHSNGVFQVSEAHDHITVKGKECATYGTYQKKDGKYYSLGTLTVGQVEEYTGVKSENAQYFN